MPRIAIPRHDFAPGADYARHIDDALHRPDPTVGWTGDYDLFAVWHRLLRRWEVWRHEAEGDRMIVGCPSGERLDITVLLKGLVKRDTTLRANSAMQQMERMLAHNDALDRERTEQATEALSETMQKVYHAAVHKSGEYGYVAPVSLSGAWKGE